MSAERGPDPGFSGRFTFSVDGMEIGSFSEVAGLTVEVAVEEVLEGGQNDFAHKLPGRMSYPNLTLKRGVTESDTLFQWFQRAAAQANGGNAVERLNGTISMVDGRRQEIRSWSFVNAFPVRWNGPTLSAGASDLATEELEIAHHGFQPA